MVWATEIGGSQEVAETLHRQAEENIRIYRSRRQKCFAIMSVCMDAAVHPLPEEPTVFFLYNPFLPPVMTRVLANIKGSLDRTPRQIMVVYYNPLSAHVIEGFAFLPHKQEMSLHYDVTREIPRRVTVFHNSGRGGSISSPAGRPRRLSGTSTASRPVRSRCQ